MRLFRLSLNVEPNWSATWVRMGNGRRAAWQKAPIAPYRDTSPLSLPYVMPRTFMLLPEALAVGRRMADDSEHVP
jgi:hypothetical protein